MNIESPVQANWYEHFFHGVFLDLWRKAVTPEQTRQEVDFLAATFDLSARPGRRILDVPCGNGRHSIGLAGKGARVTGVDLSEEFITEARSNARAAGVEVDWSWSDMRRLPWSGEF